MPQRNVFAIVMAAGGGRRFGGQKLLQPHRGVPLAARALRSAESACGARSVLVTGSEWRRVFDACAPLSGFLVRNDDWQSGLGGSIAAGVRPVAQVADAVLLLLADQPLVTGEHLGTVIDRWNGSGRCVVATGFAGLAGPPALFPAAYFDALAALSGDRGARAVLASAARHVETVPFEPAAVDIDRPEDLSKLR